MGVVPLLRRDDRGQLHATPSFRHNRLEVSTLSAVRADVRPVGAAACLGRAESGRGGRRRGRRRDRALRRARAEPSGGRRRHCVRADRIAAGVSGVQPGGIRQQWGTAVNCLLAREGLDTYRDAQARLEMRFDPVPGVRRPLPRPPRGDADTTCCKRRAPRTGSASPRGSSSLTRRRGRPWARPVLPPRCRVVRRGRLHRSTPGGARDARRARLRRPRRRRGPRAGDGGPAARVRRGNELHGCERRRGRGLGVARAAPGVADRAGGPLPLPERADPERLLEPLLISPSVTSQRSSWWTAADGQRSHCSRRSLPRTRRWRRHVRECVEALLPALEFVALPLLVEGFYDVTPGHQAILGVERGRVGGFSGHGSCSRLRWAGSSRGDRARKRRRGAARARCWPARRGTPAPSRRSSRLAWSTASSSNSTCTYSSSARRRTRVVFAGSTPANASWCARTGSLPLAALGRERWGQEDVLARGSELGRGRGGAG